MNFLRNLFGKKQPEGVSITLWAEDEATAKQLAADEFFLIGTLMSDSSIASKDFQEALSKGGSLSHEISPNLTKGGYNVKLTVTPSTTVSERSEDVVSLIAQLDHDDVEVRAHAAESLGRLASPKAIRPLYQLMRAESLRILQSTMSLYGGSQADFDRSDKLITAQVRRKAANALKNIGSPAIPTLLEALKDADNRFMKVQEQAARVLGEMKVTRAVRPLIGLLKESEISYDTKEIVAEALANIGTPEAEQAAKQWRSEIEKLRSEIEKGAG